MQVCTEDESESIVVLITLILSATLAPTVGVSNMWVGDGRWFNLAPDLTKGVHMCVSGL